MWIGKVSFFVDCVKTIAVFLLAVVFAVNFVGFDFVAFVA
jgi:hypothetical protein